MPTTLRGARVAAVLTAVASLLGAGPVRSLTGHNGPDTDTTTTTLPTVADPETAVGEELAASLRAFDDAVITLAEEAAAADAARAAAVAELEAASEAHDALLEDGDDAGESLSAAPAGAARTTDMFRTLHVRTPATTPLGGALADRGGEPDEIAAAARAEAEAAAEADQVAAEAEAAAAALAEAEAEEAEVIASVESRLVEDLTEADDVAAGDAAGAAADAEAVRAEAVTIAESLEEVEASRAAREAASRAAANDADDAPAPAEEDRDEGDADGAAEKPAPAAGTSEAAAAPAPAPAPAPPPPAPAPLPDPTGSVSGVLAAVWCADGRQIIVDGSIGGNVQLLVNDAQAAGIGLCAKSGFRSYHEQVELRRAHCGGSDYAIFQAPPSTCSPPTARPGTSNHEGGLAVDFSCFDGQPMTHASPCYQWLAGNAARYGLHNLPSEPWHWSVSGR